MRILVADDERDLVAALEELLKHERYTVDAVYTGQGAYDYASTGNYDCIILDIMLPDIDGLEVLRRQGSPTSVEYLMDHIWGYDASVEPGVVWTYMSYLRRKLETLGSNVRITMRRGFGYMLEERK